MTADPATTLAAHGREIRTTETHWNRYYARCDCGWESEVTKVWDEAALSHTAHQLSVLSATHAIIELPEDDSLIASYDMTVALPRNGKPRFEPIGIDADDATWFISIDEARRRATAYLSAAQWAETGAARRAEEAGQ